MLDQTWQKRRFDLGDIQLQSGQWLRDCYIEYGQWGEANAPKNNIVLLPTYYGGAIAGNYPLTAPGSPLRRPDLCLLIPGMLAAGESCSPSTAADGQRGRDFPTLTLADQVSVQAALLQGLFGQEYQLQLVAGWSLGGMQSLQWACLFPERVKRVAAWCSGTRCYPHNRLFLEGLRSALLADSLVDSDSQPVAGLRAFAHVYASRAYSAAFVRQGMYRQLGFDNLQQLLDWWEQDHLAMNHHDLLAVLDMWARADISDNLHFNGDRQAALAAIRMPCLIMPCVSDQYFLVEEARADAARIQSSKFFVMQSDWGHAAGGPGREASAMKQLYAALADLLAEY